MKNLLYTCASLIMILSGVQTWAQQIAFYQNGELHVIKGSKTSSVVLTENMALDDSKAPKTDQLVYTYSEVSPQLEIPTDHLFYQGLQSPTSKSIWLYVERDMIGTNYRFWKYDSASNKKKLLFDNSGGANPKLQFAPIAWSNNENIIYLEAIADFDTANVHEGIYSYNLKNNSFKKLNILDHYMSTPQLSPDRKTFAYLASFEKGNERDLIHGKSERILTYDIETSFEKVVVEEKGGSLLFAGWVSENLNAKQLLIDSNVKREREIQKENSQSKLAKASAVSYKLPWLSGISYCVSRHGTPSPSGSAGSSTSCATPGGDPHNYVAIDFDTPNDRSDYVLAVAAGKVTLKTFDSGGYGNYVIVTHTDGTQSLYAHMSKVYVSLGDCVGQGFAVGLEGTTGHSTGDHIHFEKRVGGTRVYPRFSECDCTPRKGYSYKSQNIRNTTCSGGCETNISLDGVIESDTYKSENSISASGTIASGRTVVFDTRNLIVLKTGFVAQSGASFIARLGAGCNAARNSGDEITDAMTDNILNVEENNLKVFPNPVYNSATIQFDLVQSENVSYEIYNVLGKKIITFDPILKYPGTNSFIFDAEQIPSGTYFCIVKIGDKKAHKKSIIIAH
jgi:murein DD-endopeptidase MepM/ murein hydrolase activator NlpD